MRGALILLLVGCGSPAKAPAARISLAETQASGTTLRLVVDHTVGEFQQGRDHVAVIVEVADGTRREPARRLLTAGTGRESFEVSARDLPGGRLRLYAVLDRWDPAGAPRVLATTESWSVDSTVGRPLPPAPVAEPSPPSAPAEKFLPPSVGRGQILSDVQQGPHRPRLPPQLERAGVRVWGLFKVCVDTEGRVSRVQVLKSADPIVDGPWQETIRRWRHRPYLINGTAVAFCYPLRLEVGPNE